MAGHEVFYDEDRDLMYCDIDIDESGSAYMPFIRLALVRYQPNSLEDAHISRVILADYVQLSPDRSLSVVPVGRSLTDMVVTLSGLTYMRNTAGSGPGVARVFVEERDPTRGAADELGWKEVAGPISLNPLPTQNPIFAIWQRTVTLPSARTPATSASRRAVRDAPRGEDGRHAKGDHAVPVRQQARLQRHRAAVGDSATAVLR